MLLILLPASGPGRATRPVPEGAVSRLLMFNERLDAASAAFHVGYESPSQFSREYGRLFGAPPKRDIDLLRSNADHP